MPESSGSVPTLVVAGHPNKGKSSLVATLAARSDIAIASIPGTTTLAEAFEVELDGRVLYRLIDTPGFQRPRGVLAWLNDHAAQASDRPAAVQAFVHQHRGGEAYPDEAELLAPLTDSASTPALLYVVDGAVPYGPEYEPEMEILRYTGRPSLAIINPIGEPRHVDEWTGALRQYFGSVRVLDAVQAPWPARMDLLRAFGELDPSYRSAMRACIDALEDDRQRKTRQAIDSVASMILKAVTLSVNTTLTGDADREAEEAKLRETLTARLRVLERDSRAQVEAVLGHAGLQRDESDLSTQAEAMLNEDLFARQTWVIFGLSRRDLLGAGAAGGAIAGGVVDLGLGGTTFMTGAGLGALTGAAAGWFSAGRVSRLPGSTRKLLGGGLRVSCGPIPGHNFAFVLLTRAVLHLRLVLARTHAQRGVLHIPAPPANAKDAETGKLGQELGLDAEARQTVVRAVRTAHKQGPTRDVTATLSDAIHSLLPKDQTPDSTR